MSKYLITVSWADGKQPLLRCKETITLDMENLAVKSGWEIIQEIKASFGRSHYDVDVAIDFMMKLD